eukprot:scaffold1149_cov236-Pinguiococcus_pyrenoidosus.AAC.12
MRDLYAQSHTLCAVCFGAASASQVPTAQHLKRRNVAETPLTHPKPPETSENATAALCLSGDICEKRKTALVKLQSVFTIQSVSAAFRIFGVPFRLQSGAPRHSAQSTSCTRPVAQDFQATQMRRKKRRKEANSVGKQPKRGGGLGSEREPPV